MTDMSRRGLLGLMAAAPFAAAIKPTPEPLYLGMDMGSRLPIVEISSFTVGHPVRDLQTLSVKIDASEFEQQINNLVELAKQNNLLDLENHSLVAIAADGEGPGAPVGLLPGAPAPDGSALTECEGCGETILASEGPLCTFCRVAGASAPDSENPILKQARAC